MITDNTYGEEMIAMRRLSYRRGLVALAATTSLVLLSACGDDDDDTESSGSSSEPIKVMTWQSIDNPSYSTPQIKTAAEAAVAALNERGGIKGRTIELLTCDSKFDPNVEASCARKAVDEGAVAVVGTPAFYPNTLPLLERAGVASIGNPGNTPAELQNPISFPLASGVPGWFRGVAKLLAERGITRPAIVETNVPASQFAVGQLRQGLDAAAISPVRSVSAPIGAPDQSTAAAEAAAGADAVILVAAQGDSVKVAQSLRQANFSGLIVGVTVILSNDSLSTLGSAANGLLLTSQVVPPAEAANPEVARFTAEMDAEDSGASKDERSLSTWAAYQLFEKLASDLDGDITAKTVLDAMNNLSEPIDVGVVAPYSVQGRTTPIAEFPRIFNPTIVFTEVRDGQVRQLSDGFVDVLN